MMTGDLTTERTLLRLRVDAKVMRNEATGCLEWTGKRNAGGYGLLSVPKEVRPTGRKSRDVLVSRLQFFIRDGVWPDSGMYVCHTCDNPRCVEMSHLFIGTPSDNQRDRVDKGRHYHAVKIHCKNGHVYDQVLMNADGRIVQRKCSTCLREYRRKWRDARK